MRKSTICLGENKDADQLHGKREAGQRLHFRYSESTIPLLLKSEISSSVAVQPDLCRTSSKPHCWFSDEVAHLLDLLKCGDNKYTHFL